MSETEAVRAGRFADDLRASASVLRANPWLPILTFLIFAGPAVIDAIALTVSGYDPACYGQLRPKPDCVGRAASAASGIADLLGLPLIVFSVGWIGSERIWFLRSYRGQRMAAAEAFRLLWPFWGRYFRLGLLAVIGFAPFAIAGVATGNLPLFIGLLIAYSTIIDFVMTFVTPALAYSTNSVIDAWRIGWFMIKDHWPRTAPYMLVPPLVVLVLGRALPPAIIGLWGTTGLACVGAIANLWFKGAVARFYLRIYPGVPDEGSAKLARPPTAPPPVPPPLGENRPW